MLILAITLEVQAMKRVVTGPNGILTVFGNEHLRDAELVALAQELAVEKEAQIQAMRKQLYASVARPTTSLAK